LYFKLVAFLFLIIYSQANRIGLCVDRIKKHHKIKIEQERKSRNKIKNNYEMENKKEYLRKTKRE